jgi:hypothetical protein
MMPTPWKFQNAVRALLFLAVLSFVAGCTKVQTGTVVTCKRCNKEVSNTTTEMKVAFWNAAKYKLVRTQGCCADCGKILVPYKQTLKCTRCGKAYKTVVKKDFLKNDPKDGEVTEGFCSKDCETWQKVEHTVDQASSSIGDLISRVIKNFMEGFNKHKTSE